MATDTQGLLSQPGVEDLIPGITGGQAGLQPGPGVVAQAFVGPQQQTADAVEGIALATPGAEGVLLHPSAHVVDGWSDRRMAWNGSTTRVAWARCSATPLALPLWGSMATVCAPASQASGRRPTSPCVSVRYSR